MSLVIKRFYLAPCGTRGPEKLRMLQIVAVSDGRKGERASGTSKEKALND